MSRLLRVLEEVAWAGSMAVGAWLLVRRGGAFRLDGLPEGQAWRDYLYQAELQATGHGAGFQSAVWPFYPGILGRLGEWVGYVDAGLLLSSLAMVACVVAAALAARALAGPWAGALAALALAVTPAAPSASRWINLYPLLGATTGWALAAGLAWVRWRRWPWALLAGASAGACWAVDWRGAIVVPPVALLLLLGLERGRLLRQGALLVGAALLVAAGPLLSVKLTHVTLTPWAMGAFGSQATRGGQDYPRTWSQKQAIVQKRLAPAFLVPLNPTEVASLGMVAVCGFHLTLLFLGVGFLPGRRGPRLVAAWGVLVLFAVGLPVALRVTSFYPRYLLQGIVPLAVVAPAALFRALYTVVPGALASWLAPVLLALALWGRTRLPPAPTLVMEDRGERTVERFTDLLARHVGPQDRLMDCAWTGVEVALLPRRFHEARVDLRRVDFEACNRWRAQPEAGEGDTWILVFEKGDPTLPDGPELEGDPRWSRVETVGTAPGPVVGLWRREAREPVSPPGSGPIP